MATSAPKPTYQLIKARSTSFGAVYKLYRSDDHLLMVESNGYSERYRRFYYRDIMAMFFTRSQKALWIGIVSGILTLVLLIVTLVALVNEPIAAGVLFIPTAILGFAFISNLVKGKSCSFYLKTAVKQHELYPVSRVKVARRFIAELEPLITAAQASLMASPAQKSQPEQMAPPQPEAPASTPLEPPASPT